jgi:hypothetical protein
LICHSTSRALELRGLRNLVVILLLGPCGVRAFALLAPDITYVDLSCCLILGRFTMPVSIALKRHPLFNPQDNEMVERAWRIYP